MLHRVCRSGWLPFHRAPQAPISPAHRKRNSSTHASFVLVVGGNVKLLLDFFDPYAPGLGDDAHQALANVAHFIVVLQTADVLLDDVLCSLDRGILFGIGVSLGLGGGIRGSRVGGEFCSHRGNGRQFFKHVGAPRGQIGERGLERGRAGLRVRLGL